MYELTTPNVEVDYDYFRVIDLPISSGKVESADCYIHQKRLKISGATWHPDTVIFMLALRVVRANGWWDDFWMKQVFAARSFLRLPRLPRSANN